MTGWKVTRRKLQLMMVASAVFGAASPVLAQTFPGPSEEAKLYEGAKKEGTVVWYGGAPMEPMQAIAKEFETKYPGVKVEIIRLVGVAQYQRFMQETNARQYIADVLHVGDQPSMVDLIERGHVIDWKVPTYDRFPEDTKIKTHAYAPYLTDGIIAYNPNKVTPEEVQILKSSWKGVLDPRFKGRIAMSNQTSGGAMVANQMFLHKLKDQFGLDYLKALAAQKPAIYNEITIPAERVIAGDQDITLVNAEGVVHIKWKQGAPIRWVHPRPTPAYGNTWLGISKFAPHPYAARLFMTWMLSEEGARAIQVWYGGITTLAGVPDDRPVKKEPWYDPIVERYVPDWDLWVKTSEKDWQTWLNILREAK